MIVFYNIFRNDSSRNHNTRRIQHIVLIAHVRVRSPYSSSLSGECLLRTISCFSLATLWSFILMISLLLYWPLCIQASEQCMYCALSSIMCLSVVFAFLHWSVVFAVLCCCHCCSVMWSFQVVWIHQGCKLCRKVYYMVRHKTYRYTDTHESCITCLCGSSLMLARLWEQHTFIVFNSWFMHIIVFNPLLNSKTISHYVMGIIESATENLSICT